MGARSLWARAAATAIAVACFGASCGVDLADGASSLTARPGGRDGVVGSGIGPTTSSVPPTTAPPPVDVTVIGDDGSDLNKVAANAIADLESFWATEYPAVYAKPYRPVSGGFYALDSASDTAGLPCSPTDLDQVLYNAYYCPQDDSVAWDQEGLFPDLAGQFGDFAVAVVLAHEWGHVVQERAAFDESTVTNELQADCFAGAWVKHVRTDDDARFDITTEGLDLALAGILSLKDAPGSAATDPNAHGSGFDRVGAFQEGYEGRANRCAQYRDGDPSPYQFAFSDLGEQASGGDLPFRATKTADGTVVEGIDTAAFASLELFWAHEFPLISDGEAWKPLDPAVAFSPGDPPTCNGTKVTQFRLFYCGPDRFVGFDAAETLPNAYKFGDFAVGVLFGTQYGLAVEDQLGVSSPDEITATLRADCYAGAWAAAIVPTERNRTEQPYGLILSPGDLDEAVAVLLSFRSDSDRNRQGPGFDRVNAFRTGVVRGADRCRTVRASG